jgi:hypothetical protein
VQAHNNVLAGEHGSFAREAVALVARELMEAEIGAGYGEVSPERTTYHSGYDRASGKRAAARSSC